ncbi:response regulator transcription factor [Vibrio sp. WXL103]|uniref:response regulator transcription factor n=1 Tax=unclassified Vibrio TaxID=2614977 RepID=UPI003EC58731
MSKQPLPIYLIDDEQEVRESLGFLLSSFGLKVSSFCSGMDFFDQVDINQPGCVVLDMRMPEMLGQEVHHKLLQEYSPLKVIFLTGHGDIPSAVEALKKGAIDFLQKPVDGEALVEAIYRCLELSEQQAVIDSYLQNYHTLTKRESQVLDLLTSGKRNQQIADQLCLSLRTIEVHRSNILKKLEVTTLAELMLKYGEIIRNDT